MVPLHLRMRRRGLALDVELEDETVRPLLGELRIVSPLLASRIEDAVAAHDPVVHLDDDEVEYLRTAARVLVTNPRVTDPELRLIAQL